MRNDTFPASLLFRANLFKDGFELPPRVNCLKKLISNLNWNTDPLIFYAGKQAINWPTTCTQAYTDWTIFFCTSVGQNESLLMHLWYAAYNSFWKLSPIEREILSWLEKEVRPKLYARAKFHGGLVVDIPIKRNAANGIVNGNYCLWTERVYIGK